MPKTRIADVEIGASECTRGNDKAFIYSTMSLRWRISPFEIRLKQSPAPSQRDRHVVQANNARSPRDDNLKNQVYKALLLANSFKQACAELFISRYPPGPGVMGYRGFQRKDNPI